MKMIRIRSFGLSLPVLIAAFCFTGHKVDAQATEPLSFTQIVAGHDHTCALTAEGEAWCWGSNYFGQLGDGQRGSGQTPVRVRGLGRGVTELALGGNHTCALDRYRRAWCWGLNASGQLGDGTRTDRHTPVRVRGGFGRGMTAIATGDIHSCLLDRFGRAYCWGFGEQGQLGNGTQVDRTTPVRVRGLGRGATAVAAGGHHTCAVARRGDVWCWGFNARGALGDGTIASQSTPVRVQSQRLGSGITQLEMGRDHSCALDERRRAWCWGEGGHGQLGIGTSNTFRTVPRPVQNLGRGLIDFDGGGFHSCAVDRRGRAWCWGYGRFGQLGFSPTDDQAIPAQLTPGRVQVEGLGSGVTAIATGLMHTCALDRRGHAWCWGLQHLSPLETGAMTSSPVAVRLPPPAP